MAITYFNSASNPADNGTGATSPLAVTPPGSMQVGDLVLMIGQCRAASATLSVSEVSGQTWTSLNAISNTNITLRIFWCRFNGTWGSNPSVSFSSTNCTTVVMHVFRPSSTSCYWGVDVPMVETDFTAPSTPFTVTITGVTAIDPSTVTFAAWCTADDNTWGTLSGSGWVVTGSAQYRNISTTDQSSTYAHNIRTTPGAVANVSKNQATLGGDAGTTAKVTFKEFDIRNFSPRNIEQPYFQKKRPTTSGQKALQPNRTSTEFFVTDNNALLFLNTAGIHGSLNRYAINQLVINAKANGWWDLCKFIYPFTGGLSTCHSYNLKDVTKYQLTYNGTVVHEYGGMRGTATNGAYADTGFIPSTEISSADSVHLSVCVNSEETLVNTDSFDIGCGTNGTNGYIISTRNTDTVNAAGGAGPAPCAKILSPANAGALFGTTAHTRPSIIISSKTSATQIDLYRNGANIHSRSDGSGSLNNYSVFICGIKFGSGGGLYGGSGRRICFATGGDGIDSTVAAAMSNDIINFNKLLGRF